MNMESRMSRRRTGASLAALKSTLALLFIFCLVECATAACLNYGHSCWGAHGKRSSKAYNSGGYIPRIPRRMTGNDDVMDDNTQLAGVADINAIYRAVSGEDSAENARTVNNGDNLQETYGNKRNLEGIPMLDDDMLTRSKLWQMMRAVSEDN